MSMIEHGSGGTGMQLGERFAHAASPLTEPAHRSNGAINFAVIR